MKRMINDKTVTVVLGIVVAIIILFTVFTKENGPVATPNHQMKSQILPALLSPIATIKENTIRF